MSTLVCRNRITFMITYTTTNTRLLLSSPLLQRPLVLTSVASRAFTVARPTVWNSLSVNTRSDSFCFASFKRRLKSELFTSTYAT